MTSPTTRYLFASIIALMVVCGVAYPQAKYLKEFDLHPSGTISPLPPSNSISHINVEGSDIWIGTSKGLAKSTDGGATWNSYRSDSAFANDGIFAIATEANTVWSSTGYDKSLSDGTVQTGSGYAYTTDGGISWSHLGQTLDQRGDSIISYGINDSLWMLPVVVSEQNVTFDISLSGGDVWIASWASGLRKSTDNGQTWQRFPLPPDTRNTLRPTDTLWTTGSNGKRVFQRFDPRRNNNFLAFSVYAQDSDTIWCGTAGGVNKSTDGGMSWAKFNHQNQVEGILGNWVIAIEMQKFGGTQRLWTTNWRAADSQEDFGVSYTDDGGRTWTNLLHGIRAYDFAFKDSIAYIATDQGIYRTADGGSSFTKFSTINDPVTRQIIATSQMFSAGVLQDTVFVGTGDGLASSVDNASIQFGASWKVHRFFVEVGTSGTSYAYPNPYAPNSGYVRIHYFAESGSGATAQVTIDLFDFGMNRVRTLVRDASRPGNSEYDELWDGRNDEGKIVANGVYFYRIALAGVSQPLYGKILVLQ